VRRDAGSGVRLGRCHPLDFRIVITRGRPSLYLGDRPAPDADLVLPRIGASITDYGPAYWGANYPRLQSVKSAYDAGNLFRFPQSVKPAG